jgi:hypothetical protein
MTKVIDYMGNTYIAEVVNDEVKKVETLIDDRFLPCEFVNKAEQEQFNQIAKAKVVLPIEEV